MSTRATITMPADSGNAGKQVRVEPRSGVTADRTDVVEHVFQLAEPGEIGTVPVGELLRALVTESRRQTAALLLILAELAGDDDVADPQDLHE